MKNKKGFTLVELLAVIIILAVLMLVAVPAISNLITRSRFNADRDEFLVVIDAAQKCVLSNSIVAGSSCNASDMTNTTAGYLELSGKASLKSINALETGLVNTTKQQAKPNTNPVEYEDVVDEYALEYTGTNGYKITLNLSTEKSYAEVKQLLAALKISDFDASKEATIAQ